MRLMSTEELRGALINVLLNEGQQLCNHLNICSEMVLIEQQCYMRPSELWIATVGLNQSPAAEACAWKNPYHHACEHRKERPLWAL